MWLQSLRSRRPSAPPAWFRWSLPSVQMIGGETAVGFVAETAGHAWGLLWCSWLCALC